ncbi:hypothetical protein BDQ17DRAFT_263279 [Cyathus striatus]|nr:hypothetical protein BDQ17DRAFT_263279 [Cyathus striatus]
MSQFIKTSFYPQLKKDRYAVVFMPRTYEETKDLAFKVFGPCLEDELILDHDITLRCSVKNQKGEWYWADIMREDWEKMINILAVEEIGVFYTKWDSEYTADRLGSTNDKYMLGKFGNITEYIDESTMGTLGTVISSSICGFLIYKLYVAYKR